MHPTVNAYLEAGFTSSEEMLEHARLQGDAALFHVRGALLESSGNIRRLLGFTQQAADYIHNKFGALDYTAARLIASSGEYDDGMTSANPGEDLKKTTDTEQVAQLVDLALNLLQDNGLSHAATSPGDLLTFLKQVPKEIPKINSAPVGPACISIARQALINTKKVPLEKLPKLVSLPDGWSWVDLGTCQDAPESAEMQHCGTDDRGHLVSLRDPQNHPHVTMTYNKPENVVYQIKGKQNSSPVQKYWPSIKAFFDKTGAKVKDRAISDELKQFLGDAIHTSDLKKYLVARYGFGEVWIESPQDDGVFLLVDQDYAQDIIDNPERDLYGPFKSATLADGDTTVYPDEGGVTQSELDALAVGLRRLTHRNIQAYQVKGGKRGKDLWRCPDCGVGIGPGEEYPGIDQENQDSAQWDHCPDCHHQLPWTRGEHEEAAKNESVIREVRENSTAMAVVPGEPPGKNLTQFLRGILGNRTKLIVVAQPGSLGPGRFEQLLRASMPDVERKLRVMDGGGSIADAVSSAEQNRHYSRSQALEVFAPPEMAQQFTHDASGGALTFDPTVIMVHPTEIPTDDVEGIQQAVGQDDLDGMHRVLDPHLFSDQTSLQRYKNAIKSEGVVREFLTDLAPSRELAIAHLDAILRSELGDTYPDLEYLGSGRNGSAYRTPDGLILKITTDPQEAESAARLKGTFCEYIHHIHDVLVTEHPNVWLIVQEGGLEKLPREYCEEFDVAMEILEAIGAGHALRMGDAEGVREVMRSCEHKDLCLLVAEVMRKFDVGGMLREMAELGLSGDFHSGNIMLREGRPVLTDLGTPGDDPGEQKGPPEGGRQVNELVGTQAAPQAGPRSGMRGSNSSAWAGGRMVLSKPEQHVPEDENESERDHALDQDIVGGGLDWGNGLSKRGY